MKQGDRRVTFVNRLKSCWSVLFRLSVKFFAIVYESSVTVQLIYERNITCCKSKEYFQIKGLKKEVGTLPKRPHCNITLFLLSD